MLKKLNKFSKSSKDKDKEKEKEKRPTTSSTTKSSISTSKFSTTTNGSYANGTAPSSAPNTSNSNLDSIKAELSHLEISTVEDDQPIDPELEYKIVNKDNAELPYGDGSNKVFGMENFGYTCYIASILQALYHTPQFRQEVLSFPKRDTKLQRKRKVQVQGVKPHSFTASFQQHQLNQSSQSSVSSPSQQKHNGTQQPANGTNGSSGQSNGGNGGGGGKYMRTLFGSSPSTSTSNTAQNNSSSSQVNGSDSSLVELNNPELESTIVMKHPDFKNLDIYYFLNQQNNITIVGVTKETQANSEQRKRQALIKGPIINLDHSYAKSYNMEMNLYTTLKDLFECTTENVSNVGILSAQNLVDVVKKENEMFRSSMHQDAHEFLNFLINSVLDIADSYSAEHNEQNQFRKIFEGLLTSETKCLSCENVSSRDEPFLDLSIDLQQHTSITNCLKNFSHIEMLSESNKFFCENCHSLQEAAKTIKIKKSPKLLALHLKRFKYSEELGRMVKLFDRVEYNKTLRMFNTTDDSEDQDKLYELYAVVVHIGGGPYHGHYVSLIKTEKFGWLLFDDETVEAVDDNFVYRFYGDGPGISTAYLLFYKEIESDLESEFVEKQLYNGLDDEEDEPQQSPQQGGNNASHDNITSSSISSPIAQQNDGSSETANELSQAKTVSPPSPTPEENGSGKDQKEHHKKKSRMFGFKKKN